ncbi:MAG: pilC [Bacillales bacterium]|nr:pilC [Bacillales bacterium]
MPKFEYKAVNNQNKKFTGTLDARDEQDLYRLLRLENLTLLKSKMIQEKIKTPKLKANEISEFSRQFADMIDAGIPIIRAISIMKDREDLKPKVRKVYEILYKNISNGLMISEAMKLCGNTFPQLFINMYTSGELSGQLEKTARKMSVHYDKEHRLNGKVKSAMNYPKILMVITILVVLIIFTFVLPTFTSMYKNMPLPLPTRIVMGISDFLVSKWYIILILSLSAVWLFQFMKKIDRFAIALDKLKLKLPVFKNLLKIIYTARFSRTLSSLYASGVPLVSALQITSTIIGNRFIEEQIPSVIKNVRDGEPLSNSIAKVNGFDKKIVATIHIGEEAGRLVDMLESTSDSYEYEAELATTRLVSMLEPAMIVIMAIIVGSVMLAVVMPMFGMYSQIK